MKHPSRPILLILLLCFLFQGCEAQEPPGTLVGMTIRQPAVAGKFYPADREKLQGAIEEYLKDAVIFSSSSAPVALIAPHAGYIYSGQIAADAYRQVKDYKYDLVIILGTNHTTAGFNDVSIYTGDAYQTPLGLLQIDKKLSRKLLDMNRRYIYNPSVHWKEHSVEVHVPFIQHLFPKARMIGVVIGSTDLELCTQFGRDIAEISKGKRTLIVASSDLSHYPDYEGAVKVDTEVLGAIVNESAEKVKSTITRQLRKGIRNLSTCACGEGPILTVMAAAEALGVKDRTLISYANSGDAVVGNRGRVVGYGAVVFGKLKKVSSDSEGKINKDGVLGLSQKSDLLQLARETIHRYLTTETTPLPRGFYGIAQNQQGAFVTLKINGNLRGCIGHMAEDMPLCRVIGSMALQSAFNDRRFRPVTLDELDEIEIEISALSPFRQVASKDDIVVGRDGIVIKKAGKSAVYLPQVATEQGWSLEETLSNLCMKAGLPQDAWKRGAEFFTFQADVFHEGEF